MREIIKFFVVLLCFPLFLIGGIIAIIRLIVEFTLTVSDDFYEFLIIKLDNIMNQIMSKK